MKHILVLLGLAVSAAVAAQPVYRCGADGRTYSQRPCDAGAIVHVADERSDAQRAEARRVAAHDRALGAEMERDRRLREASFRPARAAALTSKPADEAKPGSDRRKQKKMARATRIVGMDVAAPAKARSKP